MTTHWANAIRALSMDAVQKAKSGHPGMPMGMADIAEVLWREFLRHDPKDPTFPNRDRFVVSNGHGSMLLYSALHLSGYDLSIDDLKAFRQWHSRTPGHPEIDETPGVSTTTGPLGQGIANAVGMAMAEKQLAHTFNRPGFDLIDHFTYVFLGDGCLMEGISHEACSLAGTWQLGKLICFWDDNGISIDGELDDWFTEDIPKRFESYGWQVISGVDGHDRESIANAIRLAQGTVNQPTLICCKTVIGYGSPAKAGTADCHGAPLGDAEIAATRAQLGWEYPPFEIPQEIYQAWSGVEKGAQLHHAWKAQRAAYRQQFPELDQALQIRLEGGLPRNWASICQEGFDYAKGLPAMATRQASQQAIQYFAAHLPAMIGGSADLTGSNNTDWKSCVPITRKNPHGNYIHYGVREFGMAAIMNGLALYGGFIPFGGTFLVFSDYARNAMRMSALMKQKVIYVMTHDSIGLGEDGPTHQPVEHLNSLRLIPHLQVWRPCDVVETFAAWKASLTYQGPSVLALSRQLLPLCPRTDSQIQAIDLGGYVLAADADAAVPSSVSDVILVASGSEVGLATRAREQLSQQGIIASVVSMPCLDRFQALPIGQQRACLPAGVPVVVIEAGTSALWYSLSPDVVDVMGVDRFGASAPGPVMFEKHGLTVESVVSKVLSCVKK